MLRNLLRAFVTALGTMAIPGIIMLIQAMYEAFARKDLFASLPSWGPFVAYLLGGAVSASIFYFLSDGIAAAIEKGVKRLEQNLRDMPSMALLAGGIGLIVGLIVAALFSVVIALIPVAWVSVPLTIIFYIIFGYLGLIIGMERRHDISDYFTAVFSRGEKTAPHETGAKLLDTSAIIDGRIFDVIRTGIVDGTIVVPSFVLQELQKVAASEDGVKRSRGRRGLDLLRDAQQSGKSVISVVDRDYPETSDTDVKLIKLARDLNGKVITTNYSLNKVAQVQDIQVFNINELANALKPALAAGEVLSVSVVKEGREPGQGVAYLDDGTMVVVEHGADQIHRSVEVTVTSVLQTPAGRMIFARRNDSQEEA